MNLPSRRFYYRPVACVLLTALLTASGFGLGKRTSASDERLSVVDSIVKDAIHDGQVPGAVVLVWHDGQVIYRKAFGNRALEPRREAMTIDTIFDLASLTKVVATTTAVMQLVQTGKIRLNDPVAKYIPEFAQNDKQDITIRELLTHFSGLTRRSRLDRALGRPRHRLENGLCREADLPSRIEVPLQRHQFHHAGRAGGAHLRHHARPVLREKHLQSAEDDAHPLSAAGGLAAEDRSHPV